MDESKTQSPVPTPTPTPALHCEQCDVCDNKMLLHSSPWAIVVLTGTYKQMCRLCWCRTYILGDVGITFCDECSASFFVHKLECQRVVTEWVHCGNKEGMVCPSCVRGTTATARKAPPVVETKCTTTFNGDPVTTTIRLWKHPSSAQGNG